MATIDDTPALDYEDILWIELSRALPYIEADSCSFCDAIPVMTCNTCHAALCRSHSSCFCDYSRKFPS